MEETITNPATITAGIDVSKGKLDIVVHGQAGSWQVENVNHGWRRLVRRLVEAKVTRIGIEASGGYERGIVAHLRAKSFAVHVLQPRQVKAMAQLLLRRAKNDVLDAALIAACAHSLDHVKDGPDPRLEALADPLTFLEQTEEDLNRLKIRMEHIAQPRLRRMVKADIARLQARRKAEIAQLVRSVRVYIDLGQRLDLVLSIPGLGERTAIAIVIRMPELGSVSREEAAALAGLAPFDCDSGKYKGQRHIAGGRTRLRRSLYAAALAAAFHWNPPLKAFYKRLVENGKNHKTALTACARKLLIYANTIVQRGTPWINQPAAA